MLRMCLKKLELLGLLTREVVLAQLWLNRTTLGKYVVKASLGTFF